MTADRRSEIYLKGIPASPGIAMGPIFLYRDHTHEPELRIIPVSKLDDEISRFQRAIRASRDYLKKIHRETDQKYGNDFAEIVQIQISILDDEIFLKEVEKLIREHRYNAAYATFKVFQEKKEHFLKLSDDYMRERAFDIQTLKRLILKKLSGKKLDINYKKKSIIVTDNINPADIIRLHHKDILGFCTNVGGKNSHTAIVARSLGVPAVVGTEYITTAAKSGDYLILNGNDGVVIINPTPETIKEYSEKQRKFLILENGLLQDAMKPARTRDGKNITVMANLEFIEELEQFRNSGAEGIGLYRTEGLFFSGGTLPGEEFQTQTYIKFAENAAPYEVIIRTLDVGGDKILPDLADLPESNPFLGWRAIRFCLDHKEVFVPQLKAILQANLHGNIKLLLPMISALEEVRQFKEILKEAITLLKNEHKEFNADLEIGIMVEIPSAAIMIDSFLDEVDFISIGTNDLIQYTLAVDRANEKVSYLYNHYHPSLLNLIKKVIDAAKSKMKPVGMCGEMAGDPVAVPLLIGMGLENFSATPSRIPEIKNVIRNISLKECTNLYHAVQKMKTTSEIQKKCEDFYAGIFTISSKTVNNI